MNPNDTKIEAYPAEYQLKPPVGIKITHKPTGVSVISESYRSQHLNKKAALAMLELEVHNFKVKQREEAEKKKKAEQAAKKAKEIE